MKTLKFPFQKIHDNAIPPTKISGNLGFDLHVVSDNEFNFDVNLKNYCYILKPNEQKIFHTGLKMAIPVGYGVLLRDRSGMAAKHGIVASAGVFDSTYRGEWLICLRNTSNTEYIIEEGDRIIQGIVVPEFAIQFIEDDLDQTERGEKGFGSSGK